MPFPRKWIKLDDMVLCILNQTQKNTTCFPLYAELMGKEAMQYKGSP